jgi:hypothetical protein
MKLPSIRLAVQDARDTFRRFPVIIIDAILGTLSALILIDHEGPEEPTFLFKIMFAAILGFLLLLSFALYSERHSYSRTKALMLQGGGVILLFLYSFAVPMDMRWVPESFLIRFFLLLAAMFLMVLATPTAGTGNDNGFWHFNWRLFIRLMTAGLYSVVLFAGFALALAALENLFGVHVRPQWYGELWVVILGLFAPWFTLAGLPADHAQVETDTSYPKGLKVFALYILGPIVLAYLVILYAYLIKVLLAWDWPKGWVSGLIFGFAGCGILLTVALKPLIEKEGMAWIRRATTAFALILIPLIVMLFLAISRRVSDYGITESRYLGYAVAAWLVILAGWYLISRKRALWFIPLSLCCGAFAISVGPWGMLAVSESSQIARLERTLRANGILKDGHVTEVHAGVDVENAQQISAILQYLQSRHGFEGIQPWFATNLHADTTKEPTRWMTAERVAALIGVKYIQYWEGRDAGSISLTAERAFRFEGYDHVARLPQYTHGPEQVDTLGGGIFMKKRDGLNQLIFTLADTSKHLLTVDLSAHAAAILHDSTRSTVRAIPDSAMMLRASANGLSVCICPWTLSVWRNEGKYRVTYLDAVVLYSLPVSR